MTSTLSHRYWPQLGLMLLLGAALPAAALASTPDDEADTVVIGDGDHQLRLTVADGVLVITNDENGRITTTEVDMAQLGDLVAASMDDAMDGLDTVLANLGEMQMQMRLGQDNRLNVEFDDTEFELDLDQIMHQVSAAVELGLAEIDVDRWSRCRPRGSEPTEEEMRRELHALQKEMRELRRELQRLQDEKSE